MYMKWLLKRGVKYKMTSTQRELDFPFDSEEEYELILGESFLSSRPNTGFHTIRCKTFWWLSECFCD